MRDHVTTRRRTFFSYGKKPGKKPLALPRIRAPASIYFGI